jgi:hypothetical protein
MRDVSFKEVLCENFLGFGVGLIDIVFLEDDLIGFGLVFIGMNDILVIFIELVVGFTHLGCKSMIS